MVLYTTDRELRGREAMTADREDLFRPEPGLLDLPTRAVMELLSEGRDADV